MKQISDI